MLLKIFAGNLNSRKYSSERVLFLVFISILIVSFYILYLETILYVNVYYTLFSIKSTISKVSINIQENGTESPQGYINLQLIIYNPSRIDVQIINLDFTHGIFLNNVKLNYYEPKIFSHLNLRVPKGEQRILNLRFEVTSQEDLEYLLEVNTTRKETYWHFIIYSIVKVAFKEDKIDLSSTYVTYERKNLNLDL